MGAFNMAAPEPLTWDNTGGEYGGILPEQTPDNITVGLRTYLNSQVPYTPTMYNPTFPVYVRATDNGPGDYTYSPDNVYSNPIDQQFTSRYGATNYDPMVQPAILRFEAPDPYYELLSYKEMLAESTLSFNQGAPGQQLTQPLRAPMVNEGM